VPSCVQLPGSTRTTVGRSWRPSPRGCCWPRARRSTSWRCPPPSVGSSARSCGPPGWPCRSPRRPRAAGGSRSRRPAHRRRRRPRPAVGDPRRVGPLAGRPRALRLPSVTGRSDRRGGGRRNSRGARARPPPRSGRRSHVARLVPGAADRRSAPGATGCANRCGARGGTSPSPRSRTHLLGRGRLSEDTGPGQSQLPARRGTMDSCRPHRRPLHPRAPRPHLLRDRGRDASPSRSGWAWADPPTRPATCGG
jgi:hypothetical protein